MAIEKTKNVSFNREYNFVENHFKKLIKNIFKSTGLIYHQIAKVVGVAARRQAGETPGA